MELPVDGRTDIFSLGVVLYELLTGERPFTGASTIDVLHAIINIDPRPPNDINPALPIVVASTSQDYHPSISASGRWVYYLPDHQNLYRVPGPAQNWRSATPEKVTDFALTPVSFIENPQLSRDGGTLAYSRGHIASDIWLASIPR